MLMRRALTVAPLRRARTRQSHAVFFSTKDASTPSSWLSSIISFFGGRSPTSKPETPRDPPQLKGTCIFIDGNNLLHSKFSKTCQLVSQDEKSMPNGAMLGFLQEVHTIVEKFQPRRLCVVFDTPAITDRKKADPTYKADRARTPDALRPQFSLTAAALEALNITVVRIPGTEADDLIASYTKASALDGYEVIIVSNDQDFFQLVQAGPPRVSVYKHGWKSLMGEEEVLRIIGGASPKWHPDMRSLRGDSWGKTPGLPGGISKEDAVAVLSKSRGLMPLLDSLEQVDDKALRWRLANAADMLRVSYRATKLEDSVALPVPMTNFAVSRANLDELAKYTTKAMPKLLFNSK
ncbi:Aste57867_12837 [Aphanomyces stellatus]|uniref:Aste57867_12837 protein n=1 Tax=Aphanomyces stellatus TaxID=120398 RepID=A0A485KWL4_9STRA|nr:hypothetical protein As57867_012789 [Aphanomyces stellatus]VFT89684.1 Aste57867_12837 [Aphanomyces stellatus]